MVVYSQAELVTDLSSWHPVFWPCIMLFAPRLRLNWRGKDGFG